MTHIHIKHIPFALSMLPFFALGIGSPATIQDWFRGCLMPGDGMSILIGLVVVGAWEWAILFSVKSRKRRGQERLLGRELSSWYWSPPITFVVGIVSGLIFICT
jgi:uncharacterized membrane protein YfcA